MALDPKWADLDWEEIHADGQEWLKSVWLNGKRAYDNLDDMKTPKADPPTDEDES